MCEMINAMTYNLGSKWNKLWENPGKAFCYLHYIWIQSSTQHCWYQLGVLSIWICLWEKCSINFISNVATFVCALEFTIICHLISILKQTKASNFYPCAKKIVFSKWKVDLPEHIHTGPTPRSPWKLFADFCKAATKQVFLRLSREKDSGSWDVHNLQNVLTSLRTEWHQVHLEEVFFL